MSTITSNSLLTVLEVWKRLNTICRLHSTRFITVWHQSKGIKIDISKPVIQVVSTNVNLENSIMCPVDKDDILLHYIDGDDVSTESCDSVEIFTDPVLIDLMKQYNINRQFKWLSSNTILFYNDILSD